MVAGQRGISFYSTLWIFKKLLKILVDELVYN